MANKDKLLESAQKFIAKGQIVKAIGDYQKLVDAFPKDFRFRQKLAELLTRERRNEEAQPHYEAVAKNFAETGFYLKAIAIYKQMQKVEPNRPDLYLNLAELNVKQGLVGNALTEYRNLIALFEKNKQIRDTLPVLQKMVDLDKENLGVRGKLIESLAECHDDDAAREQFHSLLVFLEEKGEPGKIIKLYEKFQSLCAECTKDQLPLVRALLASEQANKALSLLKELLKSDPEDVDVLNALIECHLALGNHEDARLTCQHLLKNYPDNLLLREQHVRICLAAGDEARAKASLAESRDEFHRAGQQTLYSELLAEVQGKALGQLPSSEVSADVEITSGSSAPAQHIAPAETAVAPEVVEKADASEPPQRPVAAKAPPVVADGLELELDLDLDLGVPVSPAPPVSPPAVASVPEPASVPNVAAAPAPPTPTPTLPPSESSQELELELELDLGGLEIESTAQQASAPPPDVIQETQAHEDLELEIGFEETSLPSTSEVITAPDSEEISGSEDVGPELELELPSVGELELEINGEAEGDFASEDAAELELPAELPEFPPEELQLPELDDVELVIETPEFEVEAEAFSDAEPEPISAEVDGGETLPEEVPLLAVGEELPSTADNSVESESLETPEELEVLEELDELIEDLEELEALEEIEELAEIEEVEKPLAPPVEFAAVETESAAPSAQLLEGLEDIDFYLRSGLLDDAERVTRALLNDFIDHPELLTRLAEIEVLRQEPATEAEPTAEFSGFDDIKEDELLGGVEFTEDEEPAVDEFSLEAPVTSAEEEEEDLQSHFDLGIAYKEMGLLDDAVAEFDRAARDPSRRLDCITFKGQCLLQMGQADAAEAAYREALDIPLLSEEGRLVLCYELGLLYETIGRKQDALDNYQIVANIDLFFRDVTDKLSVLRQELGIDDQAIESVNEASGGRDRISFV